MADKNEIMADVTIGKKKHTLIVDEREGKGENDTFL
ncbi:hypothetical protein SAMN04488168_11255 [Bacillus sp. 491mf]|nr:hypothetical protein SAMN04488168_11255 [Bacillus sp. 491mf]